MAHKARSAWHRWSSRVFVPFLALGLVAVFAGTAQAVHDSGFFQLDGDVSHLTQPAALNNLEDWDNICAAHPYTGTATTRQIGAFCQPAPNVTLPSGSIADASTFTQDGGNSQSDNIYKGGTDDADIGTWQWKTAKPSPPKDDIQNAFAAQYTCDQAAVTAAKCPSKYLGHKYIFFGGDRFANNGNTNLGFWFMHNPVAPSGANSGGTCSSNSGCPFSGTHTAGNCSLPVHPTPCTPGDIFVFSAFLTGGSQPSINVYEWVGTNAQGQGLATNSPTSANTLQLAAGSGTNPAACDQTGTVSNDKFCALVNQAELSSPWLFQDSASAANKIGQFEFFEGGIDLTALGFGNECISTFLLNTRSSGSSVNSVAQDFSTGSLGGCESSIRTTADANAAGATISSASDNTNGTASSGTDSAKVTVTGVSQWSGTVDFYLCGPIATGTCSSGGVKANGTLNNVGVAVSNSNDTVASGSATLTSAGRYCWYAAFSPDTATSNAGVGGATDTGSGRTVTGTTDSNPECFAVNPVTPSLTTHASDSSGTASSTPVAFGNPVYDTADLAGAAKEPGSDGANSTYSSINATNGAFAGTITFTLKGPSTSGCGTTTANGTGTNPSTPISVTGNTTYGPVSYTPGAPGNYHWQATYANTNAVNNVLPVTDNGTCNQSREDVTVQQIPSTISTAQKVYPNDSATITSSASGDNLPAGGTVTFYLYKATSGGNTALQNCQAAGTTVGSGGLIYKQVVTPAVPTGGAHSATVGTTNTTVSVDQDGSYYWLVTYSTGDTAHTGRQSNCSENTAVTFTNDAGPGTVYP